MITEEKIKNVKSTVGQFFDEIQSNSVTDFVVWLDCKLERMETIKKEHRKMQHMRSK